MSSTLVNKAVDYSRPNENFRLHEYANENRLLGFFNDVTIKLENKTFSANRMVLSCYSKFFEKTFQLEMKEKYERSVTIHNISSKSMQTIIDFIYTGKIVIDGENVMDMLSAADYLFVDEVKQYCFEFLASVLNTENCFEILSKAQLYENYSLESDAYAYINDNFANIIEANTFNDLPVKDVISCLKNIDRKKISELLVYQTIINWTKHDESSRKNDFDKLFQLLKLDKLPHDFFMTVVVQEKLIKENLVCLSSVMEAMIFFQKNEKIKENGAKIFCLGGVKDPSGAFLVQDFLARDEIKIPSLPIKVSSHASTCFNKTVYCLDGKDRTNEFNVITNKVWQIRLDLKPLKWEQIVSLNENRWFTDAVVYQDTLVVVGGGNGHKVLSSGECFVKLINQWQAIPNLNCARFGHQLVVCDKYLYALGGWNTSTLSSVESLSSLVNKWQYGEPMKTPRKSFAAVNYQNCIYVIGGKTQERNDALSTTEKYNPIEGRWTFVCKLNFARFSHTASVVQNKIFVVGGCNATGKAVKEIECYDTITNKWSVVGKTDFELFSHSSVVV